MLALVALLAALSSLSLALPQGYGQQQHILVVHQRPSYQPKPKLPQVIVRPITYGSATNGGTTQAPEQTTTTTTTTPAPSYKVEFLGIKEPKRSYRPPPQTAYLIPHPRPQKYRKVIRPFQITAATTTSAPMTDAPDQTTSAPATTTAQAPGYVVSLIGIKEPKKRPVKVIHAVLVPHYQGYRG